MCACPSLLSLAQRKEQAAPICASVHTQTLLLAVQFGCSNSASGCAIWQRQPMRTSLASLLCMEDPILCFYACNLLCVVQQRVCLHCSKLLLCKEGHRIGCFLIDTISASSGLEIAIPRCTLICRGLPV